MEVSLENQQIGFIVVVIVCFAFDTQIKSSLSALICHQEGLELGVVVHAFNNSIRKAETHRSLQVRSGLLFLPSGVTSSSKTKIWVSVASRWETCRGSRRQMHVI